MIAPLHYLICFRISTNRALLSSSFTSLYGLIPDCYKKSVLVAAWKTIGFVPGKEEKGSRNTAAPVFANVRTRIPRERADA